LIFILYETISDRSTNIVISGNTSGVVNSVGKVTLTLTCATDAANPAEKLNWYIGSEKTEINSTYPVVEVDEMYDGKNVSQDIDIVADRTMNKNEVSCCADPDLCTMVTLDIQCKINRLDIFCCNLMHILYGSLFHVFIILLLFNLYTKLFEFITLSLWQKNI
jgi:hypothetical protein